ncbi:MAG: hypothetical protein RJA63_587 [Pseudomonadota bacterium]|jgi:Spy/CpxP family protein refolding chaperone
MSDIDHHNSPDKGCTARHGKACAPRRMWVIGLLTVAAAIGITLAFNAKAFSGAACGQWHTQHNGAALGKHVQSAVDHTFKRAEASTEQTEHARATIKSAASTTTLSAMMAAHHAIRSGFVTQLSAPTIDRIALEALRVKALEQLETDSKTVVKLAGDLAEILSPAQRKRLAGLIDPSAHP